MTPYHLIDSVVIDENIQQQLSTNQSNYPLDLKDKIVNLEKTQNNLKQSIIETQVALKSPHMNYRQSILQSTFQRQREEYHNFSTQYKNLNAEQRRPYQTMFRKFKEKINEHQEQIRLAIQEPEQHRKKLQSIREVWFQDQETEQQEWRFLLRGLMGIFGAFLFHLLIGAINRWGVINAYVTSFYKITADPHIQIQRNAFVAPLTMFCAGLTMKWGFRRCKQFGVIKVMLASVLGMAGSSFTASWVGEFAYFIFLDNMLFALFAGVIFICPMKECHKYFPKYRLVCNSIILMGTGIGAVFFGVLNTSCMNPVHQMPLESGYFSGDRDYIPRNLPLCWQQMAMVMIIIGILAAICFYPMTRYNSKQEQIKLQRGQLPDFQNSCYTDEQALKSQVFWILALLITCCSLGNYYLTMNYKNYVKTQKNPVFRRQDYLYMVLLVGSLCGAFFQVFWGLTFRKIGFKLTFIIAVGLDIVGFSALLFLQLTQLNYVCFFAIHSIVQGGYKVIFPNVCLLVFGDIIGESIYGFYWSFFSLTSFLQYLAGINIADIAAFVKNNINSSWAPQNAYKLMLYPCISLGIVAIILCLVIKFQGRWQNSLTLLTIKCQ